MFMTFLNDGLTRTFLTPLVKLMTEYSTRSTFLLVLKGSHLKGGAVFLAAQLFSQVLCPGQQFDLKQGWHRGLQCKIEPNLPSSMLNHV